MRIMIPRSSGYIGSVKNSRGFVMVLALMVLLVVSLMGALSLRVANSEVTTSGSLESSVASFYLLESIAQLGIQQLVRQNRSGADCIEPVPERCLVKALHQADNSRLDWLDASWPKDGTKPVYDLSILDATLAEDMSLFPKLKPFPHNWVGDQQRTARLPESLRLGGEHSLEPPGYVDVEDGGDDLIRYAVQDQGRVGIYSIGSDDQVLRDYRIYALYYVGAAGGHGYPGTYGIELGYRLELADIEVL